MSKEFLTDVLDKFAQITSILVETSKIKEYLDNKCVSDSDLSIILEKTKKEVDNLSEQSESVKDLFYKQYKEVASQLNSVNGKIHSDEQQNGVISDAKDPLESDKTPRISNGQDSESISKPSTDKPLIKLVDINKLVEPKSLIKKEFLPAKEKKSVEFDTTVVIITSSDEEPVKTTITTESKVTRTRRKAAKETIRKTRLSLQFSNIDSDSLSDSENVANTNKFSNGRRTPKLDGKITVSDTPSSLDDSSSDSSMKLSDIVNKTKEKTSKIEEESEPALEPEHESEADWKNDPKFKAGCYIKILRIPCEKLKEYYLEKLELLQINRLCDINTLKRKRTNKESGSEKSLDSDKDEEKKKTKKKRSNLSSRDNISDSDVSDDEPLINKSNSEEISRKDKSHEEEKNMEADLAMDMLHSDQDDADENDSDEEESTQVKESTKKVECDKEKDEKEENENGKTHGNEPGTDVNNEAVIEKSSEDKDEEKTNKDDGKDETAGNKSEAEKENTSDNEKEQQANKKEDASKKKWRRDKLLTAKLSSSDSEEDFKKFCKKKEQIQQQVMRLVKKRMKKAILSDSDCDNDKKSDDDFQKPSESSSSSSESDKEKQEEPKKPIRKRVKRVKDSSEDEDGEKSTRKQIRNIWGRDSLAETTKKAEAEEAERKARISEKQKKYNQIYETDSKINAKVEKVVLDFDEKSNKELLKVADKLVPKLKPHQASGIQFMWDACFESLERAKTTKGSGCILAHCMGLGKTLQVIALTHTLLINQEKTNVKKVMVVCPLNTVLNWVNEYKQWLPDVDEEFEIFELVSFKQNYERVCQVTNWHNGGGVLIIGYDMFRNLSNPENKRISKKMRATFQEALVNPGPDLVICDEGHLLKNEKTNLSIAMNRLKTMRRIVLTGTPLQNNLKEYFCMVQFIKPNLLGTYKEYLNRFVNPITNGQYTDSTPHDIQVMRRRSHVLHKMLDGIVQRRDYSVLQPYLPPKHEYVLFLNLSEVQVKLYRHYMDHFARRSTDGSNRTSFLFVDFQALQRICTHPRVLLYRSIEMRNAKDKLDDSEEDSEGSLKDFINDEEEETSTTGSSSNSDSEDGKKSTTTTRKRVTRATAALAKETGEEIEPINIEDTQKEWWQEYCDGEELNVIAHSSKIFLLFEILKECEQIGDKVLVFSQSLYSLNIIEYFLGRVHDATQADQTDAVGGYSGSWCLGLDYFRLDGSSSCDSRASWCKTFNNPSNTRARLFLISTKAGGLGINLVAANRVIIFDVSWNPSHDIQSIYRVYRFGQTKPCYIYRFVTNGTMEMKIYERQVTKQAISKRVIDEQQIDRHYNQNDLAELYKFDPYPEIRPTPLVPKDVLLGELLQRFEDRIYKYHEHQSLLENKEEECLNEEERKAAWEEFENEKKQRFTMGTNLFRIPNMEIALMNIVRKDNPTWNETQIRAMLPALQVQYQETLKKGDLSLHRRVQQELQIIQAMQNQKLREQFYQQQLRLFQQQQLAGLRLQNPASYMNQFMHNIPGSSRSNLNNLRTAQSGLGSSEVIDLND